MTGVVRIASGKILNTASGQTPQLYVGLDASKPSPGVGDTYIATDTGKNYTCFVNGIWSLSISPVIEEYSNHLGTIDNMITTAVTGLGTASTDAANHEMDLSTGIGAGTSDYRNAVAIDPSLVNFETNYIIKNIVDGIGGNRSFTIGVTDNLGVGAYFYMHSSDGLWSVYSSNGISFEQTVITPFSSGDILTIKGMKNIIIYFINGVIVATHKSIVFGGVSCYSRMCLFSSGAVTAARSLSVDYSSWKVLK